MINFLRIVNRIEIGYYLHSNGAINDVASSDIIGFCVIPSNFLPDGFARFLSLEMSHGPWSTSNPPEMDQIRFKEDYYKALPSANYQKPLDFGFLVDPDPNSHTNRKIASPFLPDDSFNPEFLKNITGGNIFQSYRGYEINKYYRERYNLKKLPYIFEKVFKTAPTYRKEEWYLPSVGELVFVFRNIKTISRIKKEYHSKDPITSILISDFWSSSDGHPDTAWFVGMEDGFVGENRKTTFKLISNFLIL